ncbi:PH domain-containing protein [Natrialba asiatica]|uniref:PH domain-containing protein n=1 Tax=Natrialba asiatica TaxID=64602 RepID=UPI00067833E9|nr:PH domain-containing protein [Natrialba asiatica]
MTAHERRATLEISDPDISFQAGFGFYLGVAVTGIAAAVGTAAGAATATLLGILPSVVTCVAILGHILAKRAYGLPERIGRSRWRRLACYLPAVALTALVAAPAVVAVDLSARFQLVVGVFALLTAVSAYGLDRMSRNRYVAALTPEESAANWEYHPAGISPGECIFVAIMGLVVVFGLISAAAGNGQGLIWAFYGILIFLTSHRGPGSWNELDPGDRWNPPELRAHEAGLVHKRPFARKFIPWNAITDVRLTDDELVLERRWFGRFTSRWLDVRCDREAIEPDAESLRDALDRVRRPETNQLRDGRAADGGASVPERSTATETTADPDAAAELETPE